MLADAVAAVGVAAGRAPDVVFDLDVRKGGPGRVAADAERLAALLDEPGGPAGLAKVPDRG